MKVSAIAVAGLAVVASAAPMKIVVVTRTGMRFPVAELSDPQVQAMGAIRFGHAAATSTSSPPFPFPVPHPAAPAPGMMGCGNHLKAKYLAMSNRLRKALGMPPLIPLHQPTEHEGQGHDHEGLLNIMPFPHPSQPIPDHLVHIRVATMMAPPHPHLTMDDSKPFIHRLHRAVNQLGPWEGRAVAFVLGCGLGVLLRMFFVMTILMVRRLRGTPKRAIQLPVEEPETAYVIVPGPPGYSYPVQVMDVDEKTALMLATPELAPEYVEEEFS